MRRSIGNRFQALMRPKVVVIVNIFFDDSVEQGRRGAMATWDAMKALIEFDIADSVFGDLAPEVAQQLIGEAKKAYDALQE